MGSSSIIAFREADAADTSDDVYVYQHWTSSPEDIGEQLEGALAYAWPLPRYEHDDMAAAFVGHVKREGGGVRIVPRWNSITGCDFLYLVTHNSGDGVFSGDDHPTVTTYVFKGHTELDEEIWEPWDACPHDEMWKITEMLSEVA